MAEDVIINIGKDAPVPQPPPGHKWKAVIHNQYVSWLAGWKDSINTKDWKYVQLGATSSIKGESDLNKYEKARKLKLHIDQIRKDYTAKFNDPDMKTAQLAVTVYLVDKLALRAGGEKDEDLADTVGVCTLRVEHVVPEDGNKLRFDFLARCLPLSFSCACPAPFFPLGGPGPLSLPRALPRRSHFQHLPLSQAPGAEPSLRFLVTPHPSPQGKDSIRYEQTHTVEPAVYKAVQKFAKGKKPGDNLFDQIDPGVVNAHLKTLMEGLTIKARACARARRREEAALQDRLSEGTKDPAKSLRFVGLVSLVP